MFMRFATIAPTLAVTLAFAMPALAPAWAQDSDTDVLFDLLKLPEIIDVMREEGVNYGETIGQDLFAGDPSAEWAATVARIYDYDVMISVVQEDFASSLADVDLTPMIDFFGSDQGQMIVGLEVSARRALLDDAVEEASKDAVVIAEADADERLVLVGEFIDTNNLIETNVASALNSNLAFFNGLVAGNAFDGALTEEQILTDVWSQEQDVRDNTSEWIYSFLFMAYQPLDDADLQAYIAFSETEAGEQINRAMFDSFNGLFDRISFSLGRAAANEMTTQEL